MIQLFRLRTPNQRLACGHGIDANGSMKIGLIGPGAIGLHYAGLLASAGAKLYMFGRSDYSALKRNGIQLVQIDVQQPKKLRNTPSYSAAQISRLHKKSGPWTGSL